MLESLLYWLGFGLCHQLPERSFFGGGLQVPVCARDTGIYVGFAVALLVASLVDRGRRSAELPPLAVSGLLMLFVGVMAADGISSYAGWRETTNDLRLWTGLFAGFGLAGFTIPLLNSQLWRSPGRGRLFGSWWAAIVFGLGVPFTFVVVRWGLPYLGRVYPILVVIAIIVTFSSVNLVLVCLLPWFERRAITPWDLWRPGLLAVLLTLLELLASTGLKLWLLGLSRAFA